MGGNLQLTSTHILRRTKHLSCENPYMGLEMQTLGWLNGQKSSKNTNIMSNGPLDNVRVQLSFLL